MNKQIRRWMVFLVCIVLSGQLLTGCSARSHNAKADRSDEKQLKIGFTIDTLVLERWTRDRDVFTAVAQELGAQVDVQNANNDLEKQKKQIEEFIAQKVDVIVIVAVDSYGLTEEVKKAKEEGKKVISYDRLIQGTATDLYITVDNESVGEEMGETMLEKLPDGGDIVMICGPESDANSQDVAKGFEKKIKDSDLKIVKKTSVSSWKPETGFQAVNEALAELDEVDGVMCGNDAIAGYAIKALSEKQMAGKVVVTGQDADLEACQRIVEGTQTMTVYKPIERLAKVAAKCAVKLAKGEPVVGKDIGENSVKDTDDGREVPYWGLPPIAVTKENMDSVIIDLGFHLHDEVYLNVSEENQD